MNLKGITRLWNKARWGLLLVGRFILHILFIAFLFALLVVLFSCKRYSDTKFNNCEKVMVLYTLGTVRLSSGRRLSPGMHITDYDTVVLASNSSVALVKACKRYKESIVRSIESEGRYPVSMVFL